MVKGLGGSRVKVVAFMSCPRQLGEHMHSMQVPKSDEKGIGQIEILICRDTACQMAYTAYHLKCTSRRGISVMEDEGGWDDHTSGTSSTDGAWHHVAATWRSSDGRARLYIDGDLVWSVTRGKGKTIPSGGTLVVGREQDCKGGCFDSAAGEGQLRALSCTV